MNEASGVFEGFVLGGQPVWITSTNASGIDEYGTIFSTIESPTSDPELMLISGEISPSGVVTLDPSALSKPFGEVLLCS